MGYRLIRALWGDLSKEELKKFGLLALGFFFLIGSFWPLKILKDGIFYKFGWEQISARCKNYLSFYLFPDRYILFKACRLFL